MILRAYQEKLSLLTRMALKHKKKVILQSVTGSGKTAIATDFVDRATAKDLTALFLTDREEILNQTLRHFNLAGISCQLITAKTKTILKSSVYLGMVESFFRRYSKGWFDGVKIDLVIADECHIGNYYKVIDLLPKDTFVIGLTATPVASSKNHPLKKYYDDIVCGPSVQWLVERGHLVPSIDIGQNKLLDLKVIAGEFSDISQKEQWEKFSLDDEMVRLWMMHAKDRQTIVYNYSLEHNEKVHRLFERYGIDSCMVSSKTPQDERRQILEDYKNGRYQVINNVGILTKGYDSPSTSCIVGNLSTTSTSKWYQEIGRGARPFDGKNNFITIDIGNNILLHGSYNDTIDWQGMFNDESRDKNFDVKKKPKLCNICYAYIYNVHIINCPVCNNTISANKLLSLEDQIPDEIKNKDTKDMTLSELYQYAKYKGYKRGYAWVTHMANIARIQRT